MFYVTFKKLYLFFKLNVIVRNIYDCWSFYCNSKGSFNYYWIMNLSNVRGLNINYSKL